MVTALLSAVVLALASTRSRMLVAAMALVIALSVLLLGPAPLYFVLMLFVFLAADARISQRREDIADGQAVLATRYPEGLLRVLRRSQSWSSNAEDRRLTDDASRCCRPTLDDPSAPSDAPGSKTSSTAHRL
jgi:Zn-dependent protease with chaperone function